MPRVPAAFSGLCRVKTGGLALHFELESARYNPANDTFSYDNTIARFVTNILTTSEVPLVDPA